jgi:hypothetical protein
MRAAERYSTREKASLEIYGKTGTVIAAVKNLSVSGACLEWTQGDVELKRGDVVRMTVFLNGLNRKHNVSAEVMWRAGNRSGVNFLKADQVLSKIVDRT